MSKLNSLDIEIKAESSKAVPSLDTMIAKLKEVDSALDSLNPQKIRDISESIKGLKGTHINISGGKGGSSEIKRTNDQFARTNSLLNTLTASTGKANKGFLNLNSTMFKLAATWGMFYATAYPFIRLLNKAWQSSQSAMDYVETYNYYKVTMDKIFKEVGTSSAEEFQNSYINTLNDISEKMTGFKIGANGELFENYSKNLGADPERLMNYQARIGAVTNAVGLLRETSVDTQKALSMLSQDLSSLTNTDLESVMTNLQSGLIGQSRALYKYGIDITQATLKTYAYEHGVTKAVSAMTQAEKMQLRILAILDQSKVAWGDMANTVNSVANQYRIFGQSVSNLSRVIGNLFLPIISKVLPYVNALLISLRQIFTLLGFKLYGKNWLSDTLDGISNGYSADGLEDIADDIDDIGNASDSAGKKAKKLRTALMGFDELNIINNQSNSGGSGSGGGGGFDLSGAINDALADYEKVWNDAFEKSKNKAQELANRFMSYIRTGDFEGLGARISNALADQLNSINWDKVYSGAKAFGTGLAQFMNGLVQPRTFAAVGKTVANSLNTAIYFALAFGEEFNFKKLGEAIASYWNAIFKNFDFRAFGKMVGVWLGGITKTIATAVRNIHWDDLFDGFKEGINGFFEGFFSKANIGDVAIVIGLLTIKKILKLHWGAAALQLIAQSFTKGLVPVIAKFFGTELATDMTIGQAIASGLSAQFSKIPSMLQNMKAFSLGNAVFGDFSTLNASLTTTFGSAITNVLGFGSLISGITLSFHEFFDMMENGFDGVSFALETVGVALTGFGAVALGLVSGPIALLVGGIALLGSTALILANDQMPSVGEALSYALTNPGGTPIEEVTGKTSSAILEIGDAFRDMSTSSQDLETARSNIDSTAESIMKIQHSMESGVTSVEDGVSQMDTLFNQLMVDSSTYFTSMSNDILSLYGDDGPLAGLRSDYSTVATDLATYNKNMTESQKAHFEEYKRIVEETGNVADEQALKELQLALNSTSEVENVINQSTANINAMIGTIDWSKFVDADGKIDTEGLAQELAKVDEEIKNSQAAVETSITDWNSQLDLAIQEATKNHETEVAKELESLKIKPEEVETIKQSIADLGTTMTDGIQVDYVDRLNAVVDNAKTEWESMGGLARVFNGGSEDEYIKQAIAKWTEQSSELETTIQTSMTTLGENGNAWVHDATANIYAGLTDYDATTEMTTLKNNFESSITSAITDACENAKPGVTTQFENFGKDTQAGYVKGLKDSSTLANTKAALNELGQTIVTTFHDSPVQFGSPSIKFEEFGKDTILGYNNGIINNMEQTKPVLEQWGQLIIDNFNGLFEDSFVNMEEIWSELSTFFEDDVFGPFNDVLTEELETINTDVEESNTTLTDTMTTTFTETTTSIQTMFTEMWKAIKTNGVVNANAITSVFEGMLNNLATGVNNFLQQTETSLSKVAAETGTPFSGFGRVSNVRIPRLQVQAYRTGGFPEDGLFFANHNELVGKFSNGQTAVANNEQIVEGIRYGVATAVREEIGMYLRNIDSNTSATANNTEDIKNKPTQSFTDRDVAKANLRGTRGLGMQLRTS